MYQESSLMFLYAVSPVHMGAGTALGVVDNPIQRERHTQHPMMAGSGLKGAFRDHCANAGADGWIDEVFGPNTENASEHAGAVSFSDAQIVCFPVRSLQGAFVYATCPLALGRLKRLVDVTGGPAFPAPPRRPSGDQQACVASERMLVEEKLVLEAFSFDGMPDGDAEAVGEWLERYALPRRDDASCWSFFAERLKTHLVVLSDTVFGHFVRHATVVEPHVRIDDETGTADKGGLFYTENLPPESLLVSAVFASPSRKRPKNGGTGPGAADMLGRVRETLDGALVQVGGDATTGRGQVVLRFLNGKEG